MLPTIGWAKKFNLGSNPYKGESVDEKEDKMDIGIAYIRVSTKSDAQMHSYEFQLDYWQKFIGSKPDMKFGGIYADYGISGKSMNKRPQLLQLLADARKGKFNVVYVKSVSRFARNTEELLNMVRELRELGIRVYFEKENIDTFDSTSEVFLTIAASIAENDLKIYSENQKWSIRKKYQEGFIRIGTKILGYRMDKETNTLIKVESEAETVRYIYELYMSGLGTLEIAKRLIKEGRTNVDGKVRWDRGSVRYILQNEKYKGDALMNKFISVDGRCIKNDGREKMYYQEKIHEPIISDELYEAVQKEMHRRGCDRLRGKPHEVYPFTEKIICGVCGKHYAHKINNTNKPWRSEIWICHTQNFYGVATCNNLRIKDEVLKAKFVECYNEFVSTRKDNDTVKNYKIMIERLIKLENELTALKVNRMIPLEAYNSEIAKIRAQINELRGKVSAYDIKGITRADYTPITEFDESKVEKFLDHVEILDKVVTFVFINGAKISREYDNGQPGNQKGWREKQEARLRKEEENND